MVDSLPLFDYRPAYPEVPGHKGRPGGPSELAAKIVKATAANLRSAVLEKIRANPAGLTADEIAEALNRSVLSVRPRVAELHASHEIAATAERRRNASGMTATVWRPAPPLPTEGATP